MQSMSTTMSFFLKRRVKSPAVVGSGDSLCSDAIQEDFIITTQLDVFQTHSAYQGVIGQIEHMIRLVIRQVDF